MPARIKIPIDLLPIRFLEGCRIMSKLRFYRKRFEQNHDAATKKTMKEWEQKADEYLASLDVEDNVTDPDPVIWMPGTKPQTS